MNSKINLSNPIRFDFMTAKALHSHLLRAGLLLTSQLNSNLGVVVGRRSVDLRRWNSILADIHSHGFDPITVLRAFAIMNNALRLATDSYTLCTVLPAVSSSKAFELGKQIHANAVKNGWMNSLFVGGAVIEFYVRLRVVEDARKVFDEIPVRSVVSLNSLLNGYVESRNWGESLLLVSRMNDMGLKADSFTLSAVLRVCGEVSNMVTGLQVHGNLLRNVGVLSDDPYLLSSLVEMYGKCGLVGKACVVFELAGQAARWDVVLWTSMLNAYGRNGRFLDVIETYEKMLRNGMKPDRIVLLTVLAACSRSGHLIKGLHYFESMLRDYQMVPGSEHYGCVIDMLCRSGDVEKAWKYASETLDKKDGHKCGSFLGVSAWGALLSACKDSKNVEIGEIAARKALELEPGNVGIYVEWCNMYARVGLWDKIEELRKIMKDKGLKKLNGLSRLEPVQ